MSTQKRQHEQVGASPLWTNSASQELRISCHFLAERVSAEALTGKISTVTKSLQALTGHFRAVTGRPEFVVIQTGDAIALRLE